MSLSSYTDVCGEFGSVRSVTNIYTHKLERIAEADNEAESEQSHKEVRRRETLSSLPPSDPSTPWRKA